MHIVVDNAVDGELPNELSYNESEATTPTLENVHNRQPIEGGNSVFVPDQRVKAIADVPSRQAICRGKNYCYHAGSVA